MFQLKAKRVVKVWRLEKCSEWKGPKYKQRLTQNDCCVPGATPSCLYASGHSALPDRHSLPSSKLKDGVQKLVKVAEGIL